MAPAISIGAYGVISLILAAFFAVLWTPFGAYGNLGFFSTLAILPLYVGTNIALMAFIWTRYRSQFNWWLHGVFPVVATLVMIGAFITSVYPAPPSPLNIIGFVTIAWALIGIVWMLYLRARNRSRLDLIGRVLFADTKGVTVATLSINACRGQFSST
ncbi:MAG TPA: hypothetical protein VGV35_14100 [Bryobacteraceae bacterium]|nr:hypothetical protein [Bryobacteraceae bacterium]